jgi:hypothetical protein
MEVKMASNIVHGHIKGHPVGSTFTSYTELNRACVHRPSIAGIGGTAKAGGADSIVV